MSTPQDPCRLMAESLWEWAEVPHYYGLEDQETSTKREHWKEKWITKMADAIRDHTVVPELLDALQPLANLLKQYHTKEHSTTPVFGIDGSYITIGDMQKAKELLAKAQGIT